MARTARPHTETADFANMLRRMVRAYGKRIADGDPHDLAAAVELARELDETIGRAVARMRDQHGFSWAELAAELGCSRQNAQQRYGRYCRAA